MYVFDFDGTLVSTPGPEKGRVEYQKHTGKRWPHSGWWGRAESLEPPLAFPEGPAMADYHALYGSIGCYTVMMTGRRNALKPQVCTCYAAYVDAITVLATYV